MIVAGQKKLLLLIVMLVLLYPGCRNEITDYTRGVGIYPGNPVENFSPDLIPDNEHYRNIARFRPAFNSSSYDYNLTAQLVTDGIIEETMPDYLTISTNNGIVPRNEREWLLDNNIITETGLEGSDIYIQFELSREAEPAWIDKITMNGTLTYDEKKGKGWRFICQASDDGIDWHEIGLLKGTGLPGEEKVDPFAQMMKQMSKRPGNAWKRLSNPFLISPYGNDSTAPRPSFTFKFRPQAKQRIISPSFTFDNPVSYHFYRFSFSAPCAEKWIFGNLDFFMNDARQQMVPSHNFKSAWMSAGNSEEWIYTDLGSVSTFNRIKLHWIKKSLMGTVQVSDDAVHWTEIADLPGDDKLVDDLNVGNKGKGRYVRVLMTKKASGNNYVLSEFEVFGKGGLVTRPKPGPSFSDGRITLSGGNWKIQRASEVSSDGEEISRTGFNCGEWPDATVPGTVLVSYWNAGAIPDPNFGDNQLMISESFFNSDFWYRNEFEVPTGFKGEHIFLNFDGINWKADVFVNGRKAGRIDGAFIRGKFEVTDLITEGQKNTIAVLILKNDNIGIIKEQTALSTDKNGGILGADNPTFHSTIGWDWIPTIRGRDIGIWNDVYLNTTGDITIRDPFIYTDLPLPDTTKADLNIEVTLQNHKSENVNGLLSIIYGDIHLEKEIRMEPSETRLIKLNPSTDKALQIEDPVLWWPKGYGRPYLYDVRMEFRSPDGKVLDYTAFRSGIREMTFTEDYQILNMYINGRRFIGRGGNWGFSESNLLYREREYDAAVAYHADMNFTMIRNWVGQTGDDEFFEACDRYGIMIWQDFWLANPVDGPDPHDPRMFMDNARDLVKRIRNHPSIGLYCGRNEGNPPEVLDTALRAMISDIHPGLYYISNSAMGVVSGGGPYSALPVRDYFLLYGFHKFHSERGMPNMMTWESLKKTIPQSALWPQNSLWGIHDYCLESAQNAASFNRMVEKGFGQAKDGKEFAEFAQWINYNGYRGMFEGRSMYRQGLLLWMSHPAWPSMVWQTYDYYLEPTAAYFGCKKACEPIHIQWNPVFNDVEVVNYSAGNMTGLTAKAIIFNMDGSVQWDKGTTLECSEDSTVTCFRLEFPKSLSSVHFIKLILAKDDRTVSENFYWRGIEDGNYKDLGKLPKVDLETSTMTSKEGNAWNLTTTLHNTSPTPVLMVRLKVKGEKSGERILPVLYSDNYIFLMPGEQKVITMKLKDADTRGERPVVEISGFNLNLQD
jgi:hypothetical protein